MLDRREEEGCRGCDVESPEAGSGGYSRILVILVSAILLSAGLIFEFFLRWAIPAEGLFVVAAVVSGYEIVKEGVSSLLFKRRLTIDFLITTAAVSSFFIGHGEEGAAVVFLFYIAEFLEDYAAEKAKRSIRFLVELAPETATVRRMGREEEVAVDEIEVGEVVVVRPGEKIPLDGVVVGGVSTVNQAPITGESIPATKSVGDQVYAGTINNEGFLEIRVTRKSAETVLSKIVKLVEEAQRVKSPTEKFIDRFSRYYTPSVILLAVGVAVVPSFVFGLPFTEWVYKALILLVVSCPCALAISTPVAVVSAITDAARNGVLIKGGAYVEEVGRVGVFAFDKTGTLTEGRLEVTDVVGLGYSREEVLSVAASLEALSEHPIAKAIVEYAKIRGVKLYEVTGFKAIPGKGVVGRINGRVYYVGGRRLFGELLDGFPEEYLGKIESEGKTVVFVGDDEKITGLIAVMDRVRETAAAAVAELKRNGVKTVMITGDNERTAAAIAGKLGIDEYQAELLPEDKVYAIEKLSARYGRVAMVGDGVNDAPALARADVGIAMGAIGSDISLETADIALMEDDLSKIPYLIELSRRTLEVMKENVLASILVKGSFAVLAFPGLVTLWLAVAVGDMGLSLAVILNAMRLSLVKAG